MIGGRPETDIARGGGTDGLGVVMGGGAPGFDTGLLKSLSSSYMGVARATLIGAGAGAGATGGRETGRGGGADTVGGSAAPKPKSSSVSP